MRWIKRAIVDPKKERKSLSDLKLAKQSGKLMQIKMVDRAQACRGRKTQPIELVASI